MWWYCPTCCTYLSNACWEKLFHQWHGDAAHQLLTPELGTECVDTRSAAATSSQVPAEHLCEDYMGHRAGAEEWRGHNITSLQCKWVPKQCPFWGLHEYTQKGRNNPSMCSKWHCHLECPVSPAVLLFCAPYKLRLNNSLPPQLIQHELSQASVEQYRGFPFPLRLSLLSTTAPLYSCMCCTLSAAHSTGRSWQKLRHTVKSGWSPGTVETRWSQLKPYQNTSISWLTPKMRRYLQAGGKRLRGRTWACVCSGSSSH